MHYKYHFSFWVNQYHFRGLWHTNTQVSRRIPTQHKQKHVRAQLKWLLRFDQQKTFNNLCMDRSSFYVETTKTTKV